MAALLDGIRVVELGSAITAPLASMMLADFGADVVKVEPPGGDQFRGGAGERYGPTFLGYNRNKRGIVLDLRTEGGQAALLALIDRADVLIDNFRPGVLQRLGLEPSMLAARNPRLVHCSITGFGGSGPFFDRPAFDLVGQALSGMASLFLDPTAPQPVGPTLADNVTGMQASSAILAALVERSRTGRGRRLEISMLEAAMAFIGDAFINHTRTGQKIGPLSRVSGSQCFVFRCGDGGMIAIHLSTPEKFWKGLLAAVGNPSMASDPRYRNHATRKDHYGELNAELAVLFAAKPRNYWEDALREHDVPYAPVLSIADAIDSAQASALGVVAEIHHPQQGTVRAINSPVRVDGARPLASIRPPPTVGEHTAEVLAELNLENSGKSSNGL
jgi:formyl-CoA transferase